MTIVLRTVKNGIEFYTVAATGESGISQTGLSILAGIDRSTLFRQARKLTGEVPDSILIRTSEAIIDNKFAGNLVVYSVEFAKRVLVYNYPKGTCTAGACKLLGLPYINKKAKSPTKKLEQECLDNLWKLEGGQKEVITLSGRIDLLTATELIEIKQVGGWKGGIGQLLVYSRYYPSYQKRLHLFGETQLSYLDLVKSHCDDYSIRLTW